MIFLSTLSSLHADDVVVDVVVISEQSDFAAVLLRMVVVAASVEEKILAQKCSTKVKEQMHLCGQFGRHGAS